MADDKDIAKLRYNAVILFLDFDGVLHPVPSLDEGMFCRAPILWKLMRACPEVNVVFSTSWREIYGFDELVDFVTHGGGADLSSRFIGATPLAFQKAGAHQRHQECRLWLIGNGMENRAWFALDDTVDFFPPQSRNLLLIDCRTGLTERDMDRIVERSVERHQP